MADAADDVGRAVFDCMSAVLLLLTALLGAYLPRYLSSSGDEQSGTATSLAFHLGNMLSGGVMLSAGFCHLLADSLRQLAFIGRFPISTFLAAVGYLITLLADQLVQVLAAERPAAAAAAAAAAGDPASNNSNLRQHKYTRLGVNDSLSAVEMMRTQQTHCQQKELKSGAAEVDGRFQHGVGWGISSDGKGPAVVAAALDSGCNVPRQLLLSRGDHDAAHANGNPPVGHGSRTANGEASCVFVSGPPRAITTATTAATAAVQHPVADCKSEDLQVHETSSSSSGRGFKGADFLSQQEQQQQETVVVQGLPADTSLPCSQLIVNSPRRQQQQQRQSMRSSDQQQQGLHPNPESALISIEGSWMNDTAVGGTSSSCNWTQGGMQQADWNAPGAANLGCGSCMWPCHHKQQQQQVCRPTDSACRRHPEDMTEACTVARVAGHLELEVHSSGPLGQSGAAHTHAHFQVLLSHQPLSFATTVLLACALCIHSILEGIALGAQQSMESTRDIMLAIAAHKGLAAYALGASIVESKASATKFWTVISMFAVATPIGIGIGYAFSNIGHGSVSAAMSALASGTFLYVALNEVIPKELEHPDGHRVLKVAALLLGFGLMSLLAVWA